MVHTTMTFTHAYTCIFSAERHWSTRWLVDDIWISKFSIDSIYFNASIIVVSGAWRLVARVNFSGLNFWMDTSRSSHRPVSAYLLLASDSNVWIQCDNSLH